MTVENSDKHPVYLSIYEWHMFLKMLEVLLTIQNLGRYEDITQKQIRKMYQKVSEQLGVNVVFEDD